MRKCRVCTSQKANSEYYGSSTECKVCHLRRKKAEYAANPDQFKSRVRRYQSANPEKVRETRSKTYLRPGAPGRNRRSHLKKRYGLTVSAHDRMFLAQGSACAICRSEDPGRYWCTDHDHASGRVRGILCWHCNVGLGHFRDSQTSLMAAIAYLEDNEDGQVALPLTFAEVG